MNDSKEVDIDIPDHAHVWCPLEQCHLSVSAYCLQCEYFGGLFANQVIGDAPFERAYMVNCHHPVAREVIKVK